MDSSFSVGLAVRPTGAHPLSVEVVGYGGRRLSFASLCFSPHATSSIPAPMARQARTLVTLHKEGDAFVAQGGRESHVRPGQFFFVDLARPFHIETGEIRTHSVYLPTEVLRTLVPQVDAMTAVAIDAESGPGVLLRALLDELIALAPSLREDAADRIADSLPHVFAAALLSHGLSSGVVPSTSRSSHMQRLRRFVHEHLGDPALDVDMIADGVNLSPRYVHRLFSEEGMTLMKWVWSERLDRCRKELVDRSLRSRSIGEIAYAWGFNDLAHFSRAFRDRFGASPREIRRKASS